METIYLDNNATTRPAPQVVAAMVEALTEGWANPSSIHRPGQAVRQKLELARESVCKLLGCKDRELIFTSGGTESGNLAILGTIAALPKKRIFVTSGIEHSSVREQADLLGMRGLEVVKLPCDIDGLIDCDALADLLTKRSDEIALVSIMLVNNETGVIQPIERIGSLCREKQVRFHTDGTQSVGKMKIDLESAPIDLLSFAAHKFHGPKGVGGLYVRRGVPLIRQILGGPQERQRRGGTENVPGIIGLGVAAHLAMQWLDSNSPTRQEALRDSFEQRILQTVEEASVNGASAPRMWNTANIAFARLEAEAILLLLSERGVCASGGSACASGSLDPSPVLQAMGLPREKVHGSIRFSLSRDTTAAEIDRALQIIPGVIAKLRASMSAV